MSVEMKISFGGGKKVNAQLNDVIIPTDQSVKSGGEGSAPEPYMLFLASLGTCAGIYVLGFCQARDISTEGVYLTQNMDWDSKGNLTKIGLDIHVPENFPERYKETLVKVASQCAVKKALNNPPEIMTRAVVG